MAGILTKRLLETDHSESSFVPSKICKKSSTKTKPQEPGLKFSRIVFDYGPPQLNLYKYVAEEAHFIWENTKEKHFMLKDAGEPIDGFMLIHEDGDNAIESCLETFDFDFDQKEKTFLEGDNLLQRQRDIVHLVFLGNDFCGKMNNVSNDKTNYMTYTIAQTLLLFNYLFIGSWIMVKRSSKICCKSAYFYPIRF